MKMFKIIPLEGDDKNTFEVTYGEPGDEHTSYQGSLKDCENYVRKEYEKTDNFFILNLIEEGLSRFKSFPSALYDAQVSAWIYSLHR